MATNEIDYDRIRDRELNEYLDRTYGYKAKAQDSFDTDEAEEYRRWVVAMRKRKMEKESFCD